MKNNWSARKRIIRKSYVRLLLLGIVTLMATNICGFIDNVVISRYLDPRALAAVGYYSPLSVVTGIGYVVILGTASLCGNFIGAGQQSKVNRLFTTAFITLFLIFAAFSVLFISARGMLSSALGARNEARRLLGEYLVGYAPSIVFSSLSALLMSLASFNDEINRSYVAIAAMLRALYVVVYPQRDRPVAHQRDVVHTARLPRRFQRHAVGRLLHVACTADGRDFHARPRHGDCRRRHRLAVRLDGKVVEPPVASRHTFVALDKPPFLRQLQNGRRRVHAVPAIDARAVAGRLRRFGERKQNRKDAQEKHHQSAAERRPAPRRCRAHVCAPFVLPSAMCSPK